MSDRKASIHILRGTGDNMIYKIPEAGQPLYDKGNHILYIGDGETSPDEGLPPVTVHDLAITTSKLRDKAVTKEKMAANSVDTLQLVDNSVKGNKIDAAAISMAKLDLTDAGYSNYFVLTSQKQTISGEKTFGDTAIFSDGIGVDGAISMRKPARQSTADLAIPDDWDNTSKNVYFPRKAAANSIYLVSEENLTTTAQANAIGVQWYIDSGGAKSSINSKFTSLDSQISTIDGRLNKLGFKEGIKVWLIAKNPNVPDSSYNTATLTKQGKYAILDISRMSWDYSAYTDPDSYIPLLEISSDFDFKPPEDNPNATSMVLGTIGVSASGSAANPSYTCTIILHKADSIRSLPYLAFKYEGSYLANRISKLMTVRFGWELE